MVYFSQHTKINVQQLRIDAENFPPYIPETKFRVEVYLKENINLIFSLIVRGRVESKKRSVFKNR